MADVSRPESAPGYLAMPDGARGAGPSTAFPGVVVVHDIFGMTPDLQRQAGRLADGGYIALAPDFWHGKHWVRCIRSAFGQVMSGSGPVFEEIDAAAAWLAGLDACSGKIGVIGFCLGGGFALLCAPRPAYSAVSANYAPVPRNASELLSGACPVIASYGGRDLGTRTQVPRLERALSGQDVAHDIKVYPKATHAFMNDHEGSHQVITKILGMRYAPEDASDAWRRIFAFFGAYLGGTPRPEPGR
jgi:carboxymethylenebutenolidase